uniref:Uncharacterized protein n=1 Tax=Arundo donax TaxID=35708 RepID=A0A0A9DWS8_ARUDO
MRSTGNLHGTCHYSSSGVNTGFCVEMTSGLFPHYIIRIIIQYLQS